MARQTVVLIPTLVSLALAGAALAAQAPVAVSPGHVSKLALVEARCPTFSWGEVEGATSYELVVYRVGERGEQEKPLLRQSFAGAVDSWTPSLDRCLERGGQYAWSVRAVGGHDASEWSSPSLFEVASGPSEAEFEEAIGVVRQYLEQEDTRNTRVSPENAEPSSARGSSPLVMPVAGVGGPSPLTAATGDSALQVNGSPVVTVATLQAGCLGRRWLDQGNGTVLDCNTRRIWLKDATCLGPGTWDELQTKVVDLNDGTDFGCVDYTPGTYDQWRVPTVEQFCSGFTPLLWAGLDSPDPCPVVGYATSLVDTRFQPAVSNAAGDGMWSLGDPFIISRSQPTGRFWANVWSEDLALYVDIFLGRGGIDSKDTDLYGWAVHCPHPPVPCS